MHQSFTLKILDRFSWLFRLCGVEYRTVRLIVGFKLTMDKRRVPTIIGNQARKKDPIITPFLTSLLLYAFLGLLLIPFLLFSDDFYVTLAIVFSLIMFILTTSMIADFSSVLLDVRDKVILDTKPIDDRTIAFAKFVHIVIYMTQLAGALLLIPFIVSSLMHGVLFSLVLFVSLVLVCLLCIVVTALFYMLILKFFDGEKLRNLINYVQIFLSIGLVFVYQLVGRSFGLVGLTFDYTVEWWHLLLPPFWFSAAFEVLLNDGQGGLLILAASLALIVPIISLWIYFKSMPAFEQNLAKLMNASTAKKVKKQTLKRKISGWISRDQEEKAAIDFARVMLSQEREFKLKVYPTLGISIALPLFMIGMMLMDGFGVDSEIDYLYGYFSLLSIPTSVYMLKYSAKANGAYLYQVLPVRDQSVFYRATLKAFIIQLFIPVVVILMLIYLYFIGPIAMLHFLIIFLIGCILTPICYRMINNGRYPFNESFSFVESANTTIVFVMMFVIGGLAVLHYFISKQPYLLYVYLPVLLVVNHFSWKVIFPRR
ncbi:hypothetical protein [Amphibacillus indicireducens]|uniref:ABC transporter permease n=1 Tax=Amphibacillus indicireducens TaxID=1076330 RepID=A0ABP7VC37_9BACI